MTRRRLIGLVVFVVIGRVLGLVMVTQLAPESTGVTVAECVSDAQDECVVFPQVTGENLNGESVTLPDDFLAARNLIIMPFNREQQVSAEAWLPLGQALAEKHDDLQFYSIAALPDLSPAVRLLVSGGMNVAITDEAVREVAILLYLEEQERFVEALGIEDMETMRVLLVRGDGTVVWTLAGEYSDELAEDVRERVSE